MGRGRHAPAILLVCIAITGVPGASLVAVSEPGEILFPDGKMYTGGLHNGAFHGTGRIIWPDGSEYRGEFYCGAPHGIGTYCHTDGRMRRVIHERGCLVEGRILSNNSIIDGARFGSFTQNGNYSGWFRGDRVRGYVPHGRGIMKYENGSVYSGQWHDGRMHGNGTMRWQDGSWYSGNWVHGKREGNGSYAWPGGDRYVGGWKDNRMFGRGTYSYKDGRVVTGYWKDKKVMARVDGTLNRM